MPSFASANTIAAVGQHNLPSDITGADSVDGEIYTPGAAAVYYEDDQTMQQRQQQRQSSQRFQNNTKSTMRYIESYYKMTSLDYGSCSYAIQISAAENEDIIVQDGKRDNSAFLIRKRTAPMIDNAEAFLWFEQQIYEDKQNHPSLNPDNVRTAGFLRSIEEKFPTDKAKHEEWTIPFSDGGKYKFDHASSFGSPISMERVNKTNGDGHILQYTVLILNFKAVESDDSADISTGLASQRSYHNEAARLAQQILLNQQQQQQQQQQQWDHNYQQQWQPQQHYQQQQPPYQQPQQHYQQQPLYQQHYQPQPQPHIPYAVPMPAAESSRGSSDVSSVATGLYFDMADGSL